MRGQPIYTVISCTSREDETYLSVFHSVSNRAHGKRSRNSSFRGSVCFQLYLKKNCSRARDCTTFTLQDFTDIDIEMDTVHNIKIHFHSCFHNHWPSSKAKQKLKHIREQAGPLVFRVPYAACVYCVMAGLALVICS